MSVLDTAVRHQAVQFRYKGDRDYVQGADLFNALVGIHRASEVRNVRFSIHGFVRSSSCDVFHATSPEPLAAMREVRVRANFELSGEVRWLALTEAPCIDPPERYGYPEEQITGLCDVRDRCVSLKDESPFTFIEIVVAMNKHLHRTLFSDAQGRWIFTGIDLAKGRDERSGISLRVDPDVNYRLTRARIEHHGELVGHIYFSLLRT